MHFNWKQWPFIERLHLSSFPQLRTCHRVLASRSKSVKQQPCLFSLLMSRKAYYSDCPIITCICLVLSCLFSEPVCIEQSASVPTLTSSQVVPRKVILYLPTAGSLGKIKRWTLCREVIYDVIGQDLLGGNCVFQPCFLNISVSPISRTFQREQFLQEAAFNYVWSVNRCVLSIPDSSLSKEGLSCVKQLIELPILNLLLKNMKGWWCVSGGSDRSALILSENKMYLINNSNLVLTLDVVHRESLMVSGGIEIRKKNILCYLLWQLICSRPIEIRGELIDRRCFRPHWTTGDL